MPKVTARSMQEAWSKAKLIAARARGVTGPRAGRRRTADRRGPTWRDRAAPGEGAPGPERRRARPSRYGVRPLRRPSRVVPGPSACDGMVEDLVGVARHPQHVDVGASDALSTTPARRPASRGGSAARRRRRARCVRPRPDRRAHRAAPRPRPSRLAAPPRRWPARPRRAGRRHSAAHRPGAPHGSICIKRRTR